MIKSFNYFTDKPLIVSSQENYNVSKGDALTVIIQAYARPKVESSGVTVVHSNASIDITNYSVRIKNVLIEVPFYGVSPNVSGTQIEILISVVEEDFFGELLITLTNSEGNRTSEVTLTPQGKSKSCADPEGDRGSGHPGKSQNIWFLNNTGLDFLKIIKP